MEWNFFEKVKPKEEGLYITYSTNGSINLQKWQRIYRKLSNDAIISWEDRDTVPAGYAFTSRLSGSKPVKGVVLWIKVPELPVQFTEKELEIARYKAQVKELREKIRKLEREDGRPEIT